jgi:hypothetical protein
MEGPIEGAEAFIPMESVIDTDGGRNMLSGTTTLRRKATKRALPWNLVTRELNLVSPPQDEDIPATKKSRLDPIIKNTPAATTNDVEYTDLCSDRDDEKPKPKEYSSPIDATVDTISYLLAKIRTLIFTAAAYAATNTASPDVAMTLPPPADDVHSVQCPVCQQWVECNDSTNVTFEAEFKSVGDQKSPENINIVKLHLDFRKHVEQCHATEPVWNAVPRMDLATSDNGSVAAVTATRAKSSIATRAGLVNYGLSFANRHMPPMGIDLADDWLAMRNVMLVKVGYALHVVSEASVYLRKRTTVLNAPTYSMLSATEVVKKQRLWLKTEAVNYLIQLSRAILNASPSDQWNRSSRERRVNAHHIFFFARDYHRACPALLDYQPNDLPEIGDPEPADLPVAGVQQEPADGQPSEWI